MSSEDFSVLQRIFRTAFGESEGKAVELSANFAERTAKLASAEARLQQHAQRQELADREILTMKTAFAMAMLMALLVVPRLDVPTDEELAYLLDSDQTDGLTPLPREMNGDE